MSSLHNAARLLDAFLRGVAAFILAAVTVLVLFVAD